MHTIRYYKDLSVIGFLYNFNNIILRPFVAEVVGTIPLEDMKDLIF